MGVIRLNQLPEGSGSLSNDDIFVFMDDPSGSGITKKISFRWNLYTNKNIFRQPKTQSLS